MVFQHGDILAFNAFYSKRDICPYVLIQKTFLKTSCSDIMIDIISKDPTINISNIWHKIILKLSSI